MKQWSLRGIVWLGLALSSGVEAAEPALPPLRPDDVYLLDGPQTAVLSPDSRSLAYVRRWVDGASHQERFSLWRNDARPAVQHAVEAAEPDARGPVWSPNSKWIAIRSTRLRPGGWAQTPPAAPESDPATDIWLVADNGSRTLPLCGPEKPYGRVFLDPFYGRVAFSPDGQRLAFVADDGREMRTPRERAADVSRVQVDQGEGYTGFGAAQIWVAELDLEGTSIASRSIRRLTDDETWYGDPQWTPDGRFLICHANKSEDVESVRFSINKNFDLWRIDVQSGEQMQLTSQPGPDVSPRISPDGRHIAYLSVPRQGPHADIYNLVVRSETGAAKTLFDHHPEATMPPPHPIPSFPLPDECWDGTQGLIYTAARGLRTEIVRVNLETAVGETFARRREDADLSPTAARHIAQRELMPAGNLFLRDRSQGEERTFTWKHEGFSLDGTLTVPPPSIAQPPYPLLVYPHGGPHSRSVTGFNLTAQVLAGAGYLVFQPNFRGSAGYGRKFLDADRNDLGGGDMRDILAGIDALVRDQLVDPKRQFVYGVSYGGFMTTWLVGQTRQFRAAVAQNAVTHLDVMWGVSDLQSWTEWELMGRPWQVPDRMRQHSPFDSLGAVETPTLILHSRDDRRCPLAMGRMFHQGLKSRGVPTEIIIYPDEGHGIKQPQHQRDVLERLLAWIRRYDPATSIEIITLGDSITKGVRPGVTSSQTFAARMEQELWDEGLPVRVTNMGIGGERTDQALSRLEKDVLSRQPRLVTIMYGTNDSFVDSGKAESRITVEEYRKNLLQLVTRLREAGIAPVLMTEPRWGQSARLNGLGEHPNVRLERYMAACREVARELEIPLVDHFSHWTAAEEKGQVLGAWTTDQCHPNATGHRVLAETMLAVIKPLVTR